MPIDNKESSSTGSIETSSEQAYPPAVSVQRRSLIKASAAVVPVIMTLRSGAAAAAASINTCMAKDAARAANVPQVLFDEAALDEWVRVTGKVGKKVSAKVNGTVSVYYCVVLDSSNAYYDSTGNSITDNDTIKKIEKEIDNGEANDFYCVNKAGVWDCVAETGRSVTPAVPAGVDINAGKDVYLLVYVQSFDGQITGATYYPNVARIQDQLATPCTGSCMASMDPDFNMM